MLLQLFKVAMISLAVVGCASNTAKEPLVAPLDAAALEHQLAEQDDRIANVIETVRSAQQSELIVVSKQLASLHKAIDNIQISPDKPKITMIEQCEESSIGDKFVLGEVEHVFIDELKASFDTRIDTGAESSSLDARNIILFERDGDDWVRFDVFTLGEDAPAQTFESKVERFVRIKQDANDQSDRRPVIHAHLQIGQYAAETDLNLSNRSHLEFPLLLGRKFMKDIAVVDVSKRFLNGTASSNSFDN